jgi:hypothetical protein
MPVKTIACFAGAVTMCVAVTSSMPDQVGGEPGLDYEQDRDEIIQQYAARVHEFRERYGFANWAGKLDPVRRLDRFQFPETEIDGFRYRVDLDVTARLSVGGSERSSRPPYVELRAALVAASVDGQPGPQFPVAEVIVRVCSSAQSAHEGLLQYLVAPRSMVEAEPPELPWGGSHFDDVSDVCISDGSESVFIEDNVWGSIRIDVQGDRSPGTPAGTLAGRLTEVAADIANAIRSAPPVVPGADTSELTRLALEDATADQPFSPVSAPGDPPLDTVSVGESGVTVLVMRTAAFDQAPPVAAERAHHAGEVGTTSSQWGDESFVAATFLSSEDIGETEVVYAVLFDDGTFTIERHQLTVAP